jgi:hypothetical protein
MTLPQLIKQSRLHGRSLCFTTKTKCYSEDRSDEYIVRLTEECKKIPLDRVTQRRIASQPELSHRETLMAILRFNASQNARKTSQVASEEPVSHSTVFAVVRSALNSTESAINNIGKQEQ